MEGQGRALDVILELMHGEMVRLQELCLEAMQANVEALRSMGQLPDAEKRIVPETVYSYSKRNCMCMNCKALVTNDEKYCHACGRRFKDGQGQERT